MSQSAGTRSRASRLRDQRGATLVSAHPADPAHLRGEVCSASPDAIQHQALCENDIRRLTWIRHTRERGVNLAGIRILFELEERLGARILEALYAEGTNAEVEETPAEAPSAPTHT